MFSDVGRARDTGRDSLDGPFFSLKSQLQLSPQGLLLKKGSWSGNINNLKIESSLPQKLKSWKQGGNQNPQYETKSIIKEYHDRLCSSRGHRLLFNEL